MKIGQSLEYCKNFAALVFAHIHYQNMRLLACYNSGLLVGIRHLQPYYAWHVLQVALPLHR